MDWTLFSIFITVAVAHFLALLSPGPDFLLIVKSAIKNGPKKSIGVAGGIASANALYISLCLIGVGSLLASSVMIMIVLKIAGGLFLMYLAVMALKAKKADYKDIAFSATQINKSNTTFLKEFVTGFMSGILNPKNLLFYLSLFTIVLTKDVNFGFKVGLGIWMTLVVFLWDVCVIYVLSIEKVRRKFSKVAYYIDKCTGALLGLIGFTIVKSAFTK
ncbi:LysE family translocator [Celerinatantimonas diazotrophica]|uniref:Threonine/homoserine/homoserine lactone efflux protein n=1 Tax=Celerinatantimonas diazotrophica TaxID=412034 RepID=A0A4R1JLD0_9GAMM|nr:LysE family transporter [Celerinatantimonas diazotrophica]TCK51836.1 threonine/homoserine/homoserine lactone efflux protein [Celerinatantimonas diazotrophica]CAG9296472.1 Threonine efflux protein [Celerinatantimonas diazotrophica]